MSDDILRLRKQCLDNKKEDSDDLKNYYEELINWQERTIDELKKFVQTKYEEIRKKYWQINERKLRDLDAIYSSNHAAQFIQNYQTHSTSIEISHPKPIDWNAYLQIKMNAFSDIPRSLESNHWNLNNYQLQSTISIQSNLTPLFATYDHLLAYYDHHTSSASLHIFDLSSYLEQSNHHPHHSCLKFRVPCHQFQGRIMHMEYSECLQGFLLATGSKFFLLQISPTGNNYSITEYLDIAQRNYLGILQKFACHPTIPKLIYFLIRTLVDHTLVQMDLSKIFCKGKKWTYPKDVPSNTTTIEIHDFLLGKEVLVFAVTHPSYELHLRSPDMSLQHRFSLTSNLCPLRLCLIPSDTSSSEQFLLIYEKSKTISHYELNPSDNKIDFIDEIQLDTEPEYLDFANHDRRILLVRNHFDIAIYKYLNTSGLTMIKFS